MRTEEEISHVIELAKLNRADLLSTTQTVYFGTNPNEQKYKFLELDSHLLDTINEGKALRIVGSDDENVVICTENRTYNVVETETSNSLLLTNELKFYNDLKGTTESKISVAQVAGIFYDYLEVQLAKGHLIKLTDTLGRTLYKGPELEHEVDKSLLMTYEELTNNIQSSDRELKEAINSLPIATVDGKVRLLDEQYHFRVLSYMLKLIEENSWSLDEIDYQETIDTLQDLVPLSILNSLFSLYAEESKIVDGLQLYQYKATDICKIYAKVLLSTGTTYFLHQFLVVWQESVPEGMDVSEEMLYGIVIVDRTVDPPKMRYYPEDKLSENLIDRFATLFCVKEKWSFEEIKPYIERLASDKLDVNALLSKYTRISSMDGVKQYTAKHSK